MHTLLHDLRFGLRRLRRNPAFALIAILSLALGIGANTAIFTLVNAVVLRKPALERPEELVDLYYSQPGFSHGTFSYPDYRDVRDDTREAFSSIAAMRLAFIQRDVGEDVQTLAAELVTGEYFAIRGLRPALGRLLLPGDDVTPGGHPVAVLSNAYWRSAFAADPAVIGSEVRLNGSPFEVIGVAPAHYSGSLRGLAPQVFLPVMMADQIEASTSSQMESRDSHSFFVMARRAPGVSMAQVDATLASVTTRMRSEFPDDWLGENAVVTVPTADVIMNPMIDRVLVAAASLLTVVVGLVLLIACANLAGFLLAQAQDRRKEIAIRLALGGRRSSLVRQLLTETIALAGVGGLLGVGLSVLLLQALVSADLPLPFPITLDLAPDLRVLGYTVLVSLAAGVLFGLAPALQSTNPDVAPTLKDESAGGAPRSRFPLRDMLVTGQVAVSLVLLIAASLFLRSFQARQEIDPGFGNVPAAILSFGVPSDRYEPDEARLLVRTALERIRALPGVEAAGLTSNLHLNLLNTSWVDVNVDGFEPPAGQNSFMIDWAVVDPSYFDAVGTRLLRGRTFDDGIDVADAPGVVIVNQALVDQFWPGEDGVGRVLRREEGRDWLIVGVVQTARIRSLGEAPRPFIYRPYSQVYTSYPTVIARTAANAERLVAEVNGIVRGLDPDLVLFEMKTMERHLGALLLPARLGAFVLAVVSVLALALAVIGLYGVVSYAVARRFREVGIRMSLGADAGGVVRLMMGSGLKLAGAGLAIGLVLALAGSSVLRGLLFGVEPLDPVTFAAVPLLLAAVAALAAWLPARRASRVDPMRALRTQ